MNATAESIASVTEYEALLARMLQLRDQIVASAERRLRAAAILLGEEVPGVSVLNLAHYLGLREQDLRTLQSQLAEVGLSSLGRSETHVLANVDQVIAWLQRAVLGTGDPFAISHQVKEGHALLLRRTDALFGPVHQGRETRIMVTLPSEAASDYELVRELVESGMDCARINCAHDERAEWKGMIEHVRGAAHAAGRECRIMMDLAGPKIRTGPLSLDAPVLRFNPPHDEYGRTTGPEKVVIRSVSEEPLPSSAEDLVLHIPVAVFERVEKGDRLSFIDCRGKARALDVMEMLGNCEGWVGHCWRNAYLAPGAECVLERKRGPDSDTYEVLVRFALPTFPGRQVIIKLKAGDVLKLIDSNEPGTPGRIDPTTGSGSMLPPSIACTVAGLVHMVKPGQQVWIDDGKIGALVEALENNAILLRITETGGRPARLRADKGINFPGATFAISAITEADRSDLEFVVKHADMVAMSFIRQATDVVDLTRALEAFGAGNLPIILKIETREAVKCLPDILFQGLMRSNIGVMIARGDLAVEIGPVRMAEMQEEILWLCEAAHVPVIWATQVLDTLAKKGATPRPEITDAAMSVRAECVMLNKGPHILVAVRTLAEILTRMQAHQHKKFSLMRALHW